MAKAKLEQVHYKNEHILSFEKVSKIMTKCFNTLHKDVDQHYSNHQKAKKLLKAIQCQDAELISSTVSQSLTSNSHATSLALALSFQLKWLMCMGQLNLNPRLHIE